MEEYAILSVLAEKTMQQGSEPMSKAEVAAMTGYSEVGIAPAVGHLKDILANTRFRIIGKSVTGWRLIAE